MLRILFVHSKEGPQSELVQQFVYKLLEVAKKEVKFKLDSFLTNLNNRDHLMI